MRRGNLHHLAAGGHPEPMSRTLLETLLRASFREKLQNFTRGIPTTAAETLFPRGCGRQVEVVALLLSFLFEFEEDCFGK